MLASASWDNTIRLWHVISGDSAGVLNGHESPVNSVVYSTDGKTLASASAEKTVKLWDVATRRNTATLNHSSCVYCVAFSVDGAILASGSRRSIRLLNPRSGANINTFGRDASWIDSLAISPDGRTVASTADVSNTILVWDIGGVGGAR